MANDKFIKEIADKLQNHTSEVNPQMWQAVSSQIGAGAAGAGSGAAALGFGKVAAIVIGTTAIAVASYFVINSSSEEPQKSTEMVQAETKENEKVATNQKEIALNDKEQNQDDLTAEENINDKAAEAVYESNEVVLPQGIEITNGDQQQSTTDFIIPMVTEDLRSIQKDEVKTGDKGPDKITTQAKPDVVVQTNEGSQPDAANKSFGITNLPNVFTPNGDGVHDYFSVESKGLSEYLLVVLDKDNNKVWQTIDTKAKWDGRDQSGQMVPAGSYIYFVSATGPDGKKIGKYQRLTITK